MGARSVHLAALMCIWVQLLASSSAFNVDTKQPILRSLPPGHGEGLFGYTLVLHQVDDVTPGNRDEALMNTRIIVSAPTLTVPGASVAETGAVYTCPVNMGVCSGLMGDRGGADRRLFDSDADQPDEFKSGQFLGGSMASVEDGFIVCAHRFAEITDDDPDTPLPVGRCFVTNNQALTNFQQLQLCPVGNDGFGNGGICVSGTSSAITVDGNQYTYSVGAPGYFSLRGVIIRVTPSGTMNRMRFGQGTARDSYQGYAIAAGRFLSSGEQDYAVSVPKLENYFGRVNIVTDSALSVVAQPDLRGQQLGEYYGFSLLSANIQGDNLDELLVGAPMYRANGTEPETGRVYVYNNVGGNLIFSRCIEGFNNFTRFGYAMANLGDINGDGFDDVAISAPFTSNFLNASGTVYIYHSANPITQNPVQVIVGSELSLTGGLSSLRGFGTSLASGVDVDENSFNDLAVGSFESQQAFLLRTRPLAVVTQSLTASPQIVDLEQMTCTVAGIDYSCFNILACATYVGEGVADTLMFMFTIAGDQGNVEQRITFDTLGNPVVTRMVTVNRGGNIGGNCVNLTALVSENITDRFNPFIIDFSVEVVEVDIPMGDGNVTPMDFSTVPVVTSSGTSNLRIETLKNCDGDVCVPNLGISVLNYTAIMEDGSSSPSNNLTLGAVRNVIVNTDVLNRGEDAFLASITVSVPTQQLEITRLTGALNTTNGIPFTLDCPDELRENVVEDNVPITRVTCSIGNPLGGPNVMLRVATTLAPRPGLIGDEGMIDISFTVTSVNLEDGGNLGDNSAMGVVRIRAQADISLDPQGIVFPEQISYSNNPTNGTIQNATQLGPSFTTSFVVRNSGPSTVRNISLTINWPLQTAGATDNTYFLYPGIVSV